MLYATKSITSSEIIVYATAPVSDSVGITSSTVWTPHGKIVGPTTDWTNHTGVCRFTPKGEVEPRWYIFWHGVSDLGPKLFSLGQSRCSAVEYMHFTEDTIPSIAPVLQTRRGVGICKAVSDTIQIDRYSRATNCILRALPFPGTSADAPGWYLGVSDNATVSYNDVYFTSSTDTVITPEGVSSPIPTLHRRPFLLTRLTRNSFLFNSGVYPFQIRLVNIRGQEISDGFVVCAKSSIVRVNLRKKRSPQGCMY